MKEIKKPSLIGPISSSFVALFSLMGLGLTPSIPTSGLRVITIMLNSLLVILGLAQWPLYLKQYVDYRFQETEKTDLSEKIIEE
jgi:hypothetical protein